MSAIQESVESTINTILPILRSDHWDEIEKKQWLVENHLENLRPEEIEICKRYINVTWFFRPKLVHNLFKGSNYTTTVESERLIIVHDYHHNDRVIKIEKIPSGWRFYVQEDGDYYYRDIILSINFSDSHDNFFICEGFEFMKSLDQNILESLGSRDGGIFQIEGNLRPHLLIANLCRLMEIRCAQP